MSKKPVFATTLLRKNDDTYQSFEYVPPIPPIYRRKTNDRRICERSNYIPHPTPIHTNRHVWHDAHINQLIDMYTIVMDTIDEMYPNNDIQWMENNKIVNNLSKLIYHCSSKYISPFLNTPQDEVDSVTRQTSDEISAHHI